MHIKTVIAGPIAAVVAVMGLLAAPSAPAYASAQQTVTTHADARTAAANPIKGRSSSHGFWIVMTPGMTFAQAVSKIPARSRGQIRATLGGMLRNEEAGVRVAIPEGNHSGIVSVPASRSNLATALATAAQDGTTTQHHGMYGIILPAATPSSFPVRGDACHSNRAWCDLVLEVAGEYCDPEGCTQTDRITARLTTNPGATGSMVSWTSIYSPNGGNFTGVHFEWWTMAWASEHVCGTDNTDSGTGNGSDEFFPTCDGPLYHSRITHGFTLWADFLPTAQYIGDSAKTGTAFCASAPDTYCIY